MKAKRIYIQVSIELNKDIPQIIPMCICDGKCDSCTDYTICF